MLDTVRKYVEAGREALTPKKADELARALVQQGQARADQAGKIARDLVDWSRKSSQRLLETIRHEVQKQMSRAGVATKEEVEALKRRIRELESAAKGKTSAATPRRATTQRSAASRTTTTGGAKRSTARTKSETAGATRVPKGGARSKGAAGRTSPPGTRNG